MLGKNFEYKGRKLIAVLSPSGECERCIFKTETGGCLTSVDIIDKFDIDCCPISDNQPDLVFIEDTRK